jgi:aminoglycoside phosphotransferase (APT) family kinase protein
MHGDLWQDNLLRQQDGSLAVIDWGGSATQGYAVYDLVRLAQSFRLTKTRLHDELAWQAGRLGHASDGLTLHLLGALGHYAARLGEFPRERFCAMAQSCWSIFKSAS